MRIRLEATGNNNTGDKASLALVGIGVLKRITVRCRMKSALFCQLRANISSLWLNNLSFYRRVDSEETTASRFNLLAMRRRRFNQRSGWSNSQINSRECRPQFRLTRIPLKFDIGEPGSD